MTDPHIDDTDVAFSPVLELKFVADSSAGAFSGHAAIFGNLDSHRDTIRPGAFAASLAAHKAAGTTPALLWSHDQAKPIGRLTSLVEDDRGLKVDGKFNLGTTNGKDAYAHAREGDSTGLSIGYQVPAGGATHGKDGTRTLQRVAVHEISMVTLPSNAQARISGVKAMLTSPADIERILRSGGVPNRLAAKIAEVGFPEVSGQKFNQNHDPHTGEFGSGGGGVNSDDVFAHVFASTVTVAAATLVGAVAGGAKGAVLGAALAAVVSDELGGFQVGSKIVSLFGRSVVPAWANAKIADNKSAYMDDLKNKLSAADWRRLCTEVIAQLSESQVKRLAEAVAAAFNKAPAIDINRVKAVLAQHSQDLQKLDRTKPSYRFRN